MLGYFTQCLFIILLKMGQNQNHSIPNFYYLVNAFVTDELCMYVIKLNIPWKQLIY